MLLLNCVTTLPLTELQLSPDILNRVTRGAFVLTCLVDFCLQELDLPLAGNFTILSFAYLCAEFFNFLAVLFVLCSDLLYLDLDRSLFSLKA